jgi:peptide chain release factor 1
LEEIDCLIQDETQSDMRELASEEKRQVVADLQQLEKQIIRDLLPKDAADEGHALLEIRPGTGGSEAALFAGDVLRMYERFALLKGWKFELMSTSKGDENGSIKV